MPWEMAAEIILVDEEGFREDSYLCPAKKPTFGYGQQLMELADQEIVEFLNSGLLVLTDDEQKISELAARAILRRRITELGDAIPWLPKPESWAIRAVLISMAYQMGVAGLNGFVKMKAAVIAQDWRTMIREMGDSLWARDQTPARAMRHMAIVRAYADAQVNG